jgi:aerobic-type carbon monoxide dehydrogenase small subunit (CoxS/CutS family)
VFGLGNSAHHGHLHPTGTGIGMKDLVTLRINGDTYEAAVPTHWTLLESLRYAVGLTGSKQGCDKGDCGACTVWIGGVPTLSCITPVYEAVGAEVTTVEGLAGLRTAPGVPHPLQDAFDVCGAAQCGFCTPGILMSAAALLEENVRPSRDEIRDALSGNLCRCTGYTKIIDAVELAAARLRGEVDGSPAERDVLLPPDAALAAVAEEVAG